MTLAGARTRWDLTFGKHSFMHTVENVIHDVSTQHQIKQLEMDKTPRFFNKL